MIINGAKRVPEDSKQIIMRYSHKKQYHIKIAENLLVIGILYHDLRDYKSFLYSLFLSNRDIKFRLQADFRQFLYGIAFCGNNAL